MGKPKLTDTAGVAGGYFEGRRAVFGRGHTGTGV